MGVEREREREGGGMCKVFEWWAPRESERERERHKCKVFVCGCALRHRERAKEMFKVSVSMFCVRALGERDVKV
jgi:hypothetical protein